VGGELIVRLYDRGNARRSLKDTLAFRMISQVATVLGFLILVRGMAKEDFGVYNLLYAIIPVISTLASFGLEQVLRRYQPEYLQAGNKLAAAWLVRVVAAGRLGTNVILLVIVVLAWNYLAPLFNLVPYKPAFITFCLLIVLYFQARILQLALGSHMLHRYSVGATALLAIIKLLLYALLYLQNELTLAMAILVDTLAYVIAYMAMRVAYRRQCLPDGAISGYQLPRAERQRMVKYGLLNNFNDAGVLLLYSTVDSFFIAHFASIVAVGVYGFFARINQMSASLLPMKFFENVVQPLFFATPLQQADHKIPQYFSLLMNVNMLVQWPLFAFSLAYHAEMVQVLAGGKFVEYSWMLPLIVGFATLNVVADPVSLVAQYEEKAGILLFSKLFAIYNLVAMAVLVPVLGIYGAALASGTAQTMKNAFIWWYVRRRAVWTNATAALTSSIGLWGAVVGVCLGLKQALPVPALVQLLAGVGVFAIAMLAYVRSPAISPADRLILASLAEGKTARVLQRIGLLSQTHAS
jgi:O-antigen/teichoic acid export membrane protein